MSRRVLILTILFACCYMAAEAQQPKKIVREGNKLYDAKKYKEATATYQKAVQKDPKYTPGMFNLGNSLYKQKEYENARKVMAATGKTTNDKQGKSATDYNIGNTYMEEQKWQEAVDAYKQALRNNPGDADAKYNLSYALAMMKKNGGGGGGKNDKQDNKDEKKDDKKDQQQDEKGKDKEDQNKDQQQDQQDKEDEQNNRDKRPQPQPSKLSEQQAEQLLNALQQEEKKLQDKMQKARGVPVKIEKDW